MSRLRLLTASAFVLFLAGCSGDTPPGPGGGGGGGGDAGSGPDSCVLVTKDDATAALDTPAKDGLSERVSEPGMPTGRSCLYDAASGRGRLNITNWTGDAALFDTYKGLLQGEVADVAGVGDKAIRNGWTGLIVLKGNHLLQFGIELAKYDPDIAQEKLKTLATISIGRL